MTQNHIGKTLWVAVGLPAANTAAAFAAQNWIKVGGIQSIGSLGVSHANIDAPDLESGFTMGLKGAAMGNDVQMAFRDVGLDEAGRVALKALADAHGGECSIRVIRGSGTNGAPAAGDPVEYAQGYAHSFAKVEANTTTHEGFTVSFKQNAPTIDATFPSGG